MYVTFHMRLKEEHVGAAETFASNFVPYPLTSVRLNYISVRASCSAFAFPDCILRRGEKPLICFLIIIC